MSDRTIAFYTPEPAFRRWICAATSMTSPSHSEKNTVRSKQRAPTKSTVYRSRTNAGSDVGEAIAERCYCYLTRTLLPPAMCAAYSELQGAGCWWYYYGRVSVVHPAQARQAEVTTLLSHVVTERLWYFTGRWSHHRRR